MRLTSIMAACLSASTGVALYGYKGSGWLGLSAFCALETLGFFILWAAQIVASAIDRKE